ncbi:MFS transporter [Bacteroides propionicifaciens]|uniref:MFS transporter n=1 Tax=Bacteroides propionicifaciens TaxID=392838 RepID=UPI00046A0421|nr:MFS transporter [Bacteroides propionicifaciens]
MNKISHTTMRESTLLRWTALILVSATMFFGYMFVDVLSPLQTLLQQQKGWTPEVYGTFASSEYFLNVFVLFLFFAGIILDKMGIRFTGLLSCTLMIIGAAIKLYAISSYFVEGGAVYDFLNSFVPSFPASAKLASIGFAIFGCGIEMAGITVSKTIVKWFTGKEMALAMGIEMAIARLGVFAVFRLSPYVANLGTPDIVRPVAVCGILLCVGLLSFFVYSLMDKKLNSQDKTIQLEDDEEFEEPFKFSDLTKLISNKVYLIVAGLCVLYYAAIFPFQKFATSMLENNLGLDTTDAADLFSYFPIGAVVLTPILGWFLDTRGKGATMLIIGSVLVFVCHLTFALYPFQSGDPTSLFVAYAAILLLGVSFSLVPAALWPSVPHLVAPAYLGSAYSIVFLVQNFGLWLFPILIGFVLEKTNPIAILNANDGVYDYTYAMLVFASCGIFAGLLGIWLKREDSKHGYGLEEPNVKK